jgi:hypothetical protein
MPRQAERNLIAVLHHQKQSYHHHLIEKKKNQNNNLHHSKQMEEQNTHVQCSKQELPTPHEAVVSSASAISAVLVHVAITHYKKLRSRQTAVE